jgi:predicted nucleic acid-binding protein
VLEHVVREGLLVPPIWPAEVANGLLNARRRGRLAPDELPAALALFEGLPVMVAPPASLASIRQLVDTGAAAELTAYDAAYLDLALREAAPLATQDEALRRAATKVGVELFAGG